MFAMLLSLLLAQRYVLNSIKTDRWCLLFLYHFSVGNFSLFAVFVFITEYSLIGFERYWAAIMKRLVSGIPHKIKFLVGSPISISVPESSESLVVGDLYGGISSELHRLMLDILNKRWQTLDLISMLEELKRSTSEESHTSLYYLPWKVLSVTDRLSSRPRFKKEEDLTDCA